MKMLTIIISSDLEEHVDKILTDMDVECYVKQSGAYGISRRCKGIFGDDLPWDATMFTVAGEAKDLEQMAKKILEREYHKEYKPCLRMMMTPVEKVWK